MSVDGIKKSPLDSVLCRMPLVPIIVLGLDYAVWFEPPESTDDSISTLAGACHGRSGRRFRTQDISVTTDSNPRLQAQNQWID